MGLALLWLLHEDGRIQREEEEKKGKKRRRKQNWQTIITSPETK
jgi:hypothetical protein